MFSIKSIVVRCHDSSFGGYPFKVAVLVDLPVKEWNEIRSGGHLGHFYCTDIGNALYAMNKDLPCYNPTVDDKSRARKGIKTIELTYFSRNFDQAESLGLKVLRFKSGDIMLDFAAYSRIL